MSFFKKYKKNSLKGVRLIITLNNGLYCHYEVAYDDNHELRWHYGCFYDWYFGDDRSEDYMFKSRDSEQLIKRSKILTFEVLIFEVKKWK